MPAFIRQELRDAVAALVDTRYRVRASPGAGEWAESPWVGVFEPTIAPTAQTGYQKLKTLLVANDRWPDAA